MITLIHGDNTVKSRQELFLLREKAKGKELRVLEGKTLKDDELVQALSSSSLFGGETVVIVENLFSGLGKKIKRTQELASLIKAHSDQVEIILWEDKEVSKTALSALGTSLSQRLFKMPTLIFQFLDSFIPGKGREELSLYHELLTSEAAELVHAMLIRRIRVLLALKSGNTPESLPPWQLTRLTNQARPFTLERLTTLYKELRLIEQKRNNGLSVFDLKEATEMILIEV